MLCLVALIVLVIGGIVLHKTKFGRYTYAIGSNEEAARRVGVKVDRHLIKIYGMTGLLAGFGGIMSLAQYSTTTIAGQSLTNLNVIAAVVIGGTSIFGGEGSIFGTVVGLFIPAVLLSGFAILGVTPYWQTRCGRLRPGRRGLHRPVPPGRRLPRRKTVIAVRRPRQEEIARRHQVTTCPVSNTLVPVQPNPKLEGKQ